ncbi:putative diphthamide synthesis protein-domain-containing protein [Catenaria anguillulae PL171]|uniref:2-(3-amino-3-carboxypropyl)histidine synthase subunit 1 n=1 Tax=Catenaria anguillulae PL171 TaxID=765915 RepID=A0A1Y2I3R6_9FUNG|nr:putative diphthamide synthesis protein-domain-containing protein [Catenaria anguillulae PL171]
MDSSTSLTSASSVSAAAPTKPAPSGPKKRFVGSSRKVDAVAKKSAAAASSLAEPASIEESGASLVHLGESQSSGAAAKVKRGAIPDSILNDPLLNAAVSALPANYNFEIHKSIHQIREFNATRVALQLPEGLQMFACIISDILEQFTGVDTVIMGDVTYGACCVDDFTARALGCDFMIHYGHSCLIPVDVTTIRTLYVFVDIQFDIDHFTSILLANLTPGSHLALVATIQFVGSLHVARQELAQHFTITVPQSKPLSPGEILGCTSPKLAADIDAIVYLGDGKFHLESILIHNPGVPAYRYDPYSSILTSERYDHADMRSARADAMQLARRATKWGLILGTLGRQGSPDILNWIRTILSQRGTPFITVCMSEIFPARLAEFADVECWVQVACPRLSIDWGRFFKQPLLSPYEAAVVLGEAAWGDVYPMDYYAREDAGGPWGVNWHRKRPARAGAGKGRVGAAARARKVEEGGCCRASTVADTVAATAGGCCRTGGEAGKCG